MTALSGAILQLGARRLGIGPTDGATALLPPRNTALNGACRHESRATARARHGPESRGVCRPCALATMRSSWQAAQDGGAWPESEVSGHSSARCYKPGGMSILAGEDSIPTLEISKLPEIACACTTLCRERGTDAPGVSSNATLRPWNCGLKRSGSAPSQTRTHSRRRVQFTPSLLRSIAIHLPGAFDSAVSQVVIRIAGCRGIASATGQHAASLGSPGPNVGEICPMPHRIVRRAVVAVAGEEVVL